MTIKENNIMTQEELKDQIKELYTKILKVETTPFTISYSWSNISDLKEEVHMCKINGIKYIRSQDVDNYLTQCIYSFILQGNLSYNDVLHVKVPYIGVLIKVETLLSNWETFFFRLSNGWEYKQNRLNTLHALLVQDVTVIDNNLTQDEIEASEQAYTKRNELIKESRQMRKAQEEIDKEEIDKEECVVNSIKEQEYSQRMSIAKDILCAIISSEKRVYLEDDKKKQVQEALEYTDLLIAEINKES